MEPLGLDFWMGLPEAHENRVAPIIPADPPDPSGPVSPMMMAIAMDQSSLQAILMFNTGGYMLPGPDGVFGFNTRAALITRGLAEITRLGVALGAKPMTFAGLAGLGDLILTATGALSRNRGLGVALGQGQSVAQALARTQAVVEGVNTARTAVALGERHGVELPISREVANVLFQNKPPRQAVADLMERELKAEQWQ